MSKRERKLGAVIATLPVARLRAPRPLVARSLRPERRMTRGSRVLKRLLDVVVAGAGLVSTSPILVPAIVLVWLQDRHPPVYVSRRVGRGGGTFKMLKLRSMFVGADASGVDSTSAGDIRITPIGHVIRHFKLDELPQLWNVLKGEMSLVGPRPQVEREVNLYTPLERRLLDVQPGITDFASIVFADLAQILEGQTDPNVAYNQLVRPGKSQLGLFYIEHRSVWVDLQVIALTVMAIVSRRRALAGVQSVLRRLGANSDLLEIAGRRKFLVPRPPPGSNRVVTSRDGHHRS